MTLVPNKQLGIQIDGGLPRAAYHDGGWTCVPALLVIQLTRHAKCTQPSLHCPDANTRRREGPDPGQTGGETHLVTRFRSPQRDLLMWGRSISGKRTLQQKEPAQCNSHKTRFQRRGSRYNEKQTPQNRGMWSAHSSRSNSAVRPPSQKKKEEPPRLI